MAPKHPLAAASTVAKRRRRQATVRAFFAPRTPAVGSQRASDKHTLPQSQPQPQLQPQSKPQPQLQPQSKLQPQPQPKPSPPSPPSLPSPSSPPSLPSSPSLPSPPSLPSCPSSQPSQPSHPPATPPASAASPLLACVRLTRGIDVAPRRAGEPLRLCAAALCGIDVPPVVTAAATPRAAVRSSMRLRSATLASVAINAPCEHDPILSDSDCETKPSSSVKLSSASDSPVTVESDDHSEQPISRLSRRNRKKLPKRPKSSPSSFSSAFCPIRTRPKSASSLPRNSQTNDSADNQRVAPSVAHNAPAPPKKKLHPFFAATAAAVSTAKERSKTSKPVLPTVDAWQCPSATVHVNSVPPSHPWRPKPQLCTITSHSTRSEATASSPPPITPSFHHPFDSVCTAVSPVSPSVSHLSSPFQVVEHTSKNTNLWAEAYKNDSRIDVINGSAIKTLVDWLQKWYEAPQETADDSDADSSDSYLVDESNNKERVAVVTGRTGCGKSTVIATAARHVGLSVLEINASTCRTGKKIREIIGDALNTHRVTHTRFKFSSAKTDGKKERGRPKSRTLIVFEDVDQLQDDEKGFWTTFQKLATAGDCRRPIVCTATTFSSQMRHVFAEVKQPLEADMQRLLINARVDQALNPPPLSYKHICFSRRTERQSLAVLARVTGSEAVKSIVDMKESLALLCPNDTRRAINLLQFWGSTGLVIPEEASTEQDIARRLAEAQDRISFDVLTALVQDFVTSFLFQAGSCNYLIEMSKAPSLKHQNSHCTEKSGGQSAVLDSWCESLDALSSADVIRGQAVNEKLNRSTASAGNAKELCMHTDLESLLIEAEELNCAAIRFSKKYLSFASGTQQLNDISKAALEDFPSLRRHAPPNTPYSRQSILSEYIPTLRTMAAEHGRQRSKRKGKQEGERYVRRTRSRSRKDGFSALDLDPETISILKKASIRRQERQLPIKSSQ